MEYAVIFALGIIIGSFLNVVILRFHTGRSFMNDRSGCLSCGHTLGWKDLVPLISYFVSGGRCRYCESRISMQYPLVELASGLLFLGVAHTFGTSLESALPLMLGCAITAILLVIFVYDLYHKIIPDYFTVIFLALTLLWQFGGTTTPFSIATLLSVLIAGGTTALPLFLIWFLSRGRAMGFGDVKFALGIGFLLGFWSGLSALILSFWIGAVVSLALIAQERLWSAQKGLTMKSEVPFAPYLVVATLLTFFFEWNVFEWGRILHF